MLKKFNSFITDHQLFKSEDKILLAVSGGMDSMVMTHLFYKAKLNFAIAHCNFGLRGEESDEDELFVKKITKKLKIPFYSESFETENFAESEKISIQMAARVLRYEWFNKLLIKENFQFIATAHHLNDTIETVLFNMVRGTGISGLHGILPKINNIIRPISFANKEEIYDYIVENQLSWREDSSNQSIKYQRNLIRNEVVPLLKTINPNLDNTIQQTVEKIGAVERIFNNYIKETEKKIGRFEHGAFFISIEKLLAEAEGQFILSEILKPFNFSFLQSKDIFSVFGAEPGKQFESPTHLMVKDRDQLVITPKSIEKYRSGIIEVDDEGFTNEIYSLKIKKVARENVKISSDRKIAMLDFDKLIFPLKVRRWKEGDWFCPLGMNKKKKLSDFMIDEKIPLNLKEKIWVITSNGSIVWIIGSRIDDRFKITDKTTQVYYINS